MVFCSNCHCDIDESKFFLHHRFCVQNIKYCEQCEEGIVIEEYEEHCKNHKIVSFPRTKQAPANLFYAHNQEQRRKSCYLEFPSHLYCFQLFPFWALPHAGLPIPATMSTIRYTSLPTARNPPRSSRREKQFTTSIPMGSNST